jgi:acyl carrier protein
MNRAEFHALLAQTIDAPSGSLSAEQRLADVVEWDSLAVLSFIALADERFALSLSTRELAGCVMVADLTALLGDRITE